MKKFGGVPGRLVGRRFRHDRRSKTLRPPGPVPSQVVPRRPGACPRGRTPPGVPRNRNLLGAAAARCRGARARLGELPHRRLLRPPVGDRAVDRVRYPCDLGGPPVVGVGRSDDRLLLRRGSRAEARGPLRRAPRPAPCRAAGRRGTRRHARAGDGVPRVHVRHRGGPGRGDRDADGHRLRARRPRARRRRTARTQGAAAVPRGRGRPRKHRDRGVRVRQRRVLGAVGRRSRPVLLLPAPVEAPPSGPTSVRRARGGRLGGARACARRAHARGRRPRFPHTRRAGGRRSGHALAARAGRGGTPPVVELRDRAPLRPGQRRDPAVGRGRGRCHDEPARARHPRIPGDRQAARDRPRVPARVPARARGCCAGPPRFRSCSRPWSRGSWGSCSSAASAGPSSSPRPSPGLARGRLLILIRSGSAGRSSHQPNPEEVPSC
jgi:hypothetical protein